MTFIKRGPFRVPENFRFIPLHPKESREPFYGRVVIPVGRAVLSLQDICVTVEGADHIPATGPALLAMNHTSYYDFLMGAVPGYLRGKRLTRFMAKREVFDTPVVGKLMAWMRHLSVDRAHGAQSVDDAIERLKKNQLVCIFPEATLSRSFELKSLKTGATRIAHQAQVPLIPLVSWGGQRIISKGVPSHLGRSHIPVWIKVGDPIPTTGDFERDTAILAETLTSLLDEVREKYDKEYGPFPAGLPWRPASMGGSAPTLEEAEEIDRIARKKKQEKKARRK